MDIIFKWNIFYIKKNTTNNNDSIKTQIFALLHVLSTQIYVLIHALIHVHVAYILCSIHLTCHDLSYRSLLVITSHDLSTGRPVETSESIFILISCFIWIWSNLKMENKIILKISISYLKHHLLYFNEIQISIFNWIIIKINTLILFFLCLEIIFHILKEYNN